MIGTRNLCGVLEACTNQPVALADHAPWYVGACERLVLELVQETFGERNPIEGWFLILKQRVKRFYKRWPWNASVGRMEGWLRGFVALYHLEGRVALT